MTHHETASLRVLLATDDSAEARVAEAWAARLRWSLPTVVDVVCVAGRGIPRMGWGIGEAGDPVRQAVETIRRAELDAAQRVANTVGERLQLAGVHVRTWARQGDTVGELLATMEDELPALVVVGPRGRSGLAAAILGSTTYQLIERAAAPLLVARPPGSSEGPLPEHVVVIVDGTMSASHAIAWLRDAGWMAGARITLLGLLGGSAGLGDEAHVLADEVERLVREDAARTLEKLGEPLAQLDTTIRFELRAGHPLQAALDGATELGADLIAIAAAPRATREPLPTKIARHAERSVLLVPTR